MRGEIASCLPGNTASACQAGFLLYLLVRNYCYQTLHLEFAYPSHTNRPSLAGGVACLVAQASQ